MDDITGVLPGFGRSLDLFEKPERCRYNQRHQHG